VDNLVLDCDFTKEIDGDINNILFEDEDIEIIENIIPISNIILRIHINVL
jgi:hypothetical protein